ncbi:hypothetical protein RHS04_09705 [Rhizoctonia solani]|uniref:Uncharacterized protein n=1 Tax=Rhizoctonia solani TaxID=456999 RepID=A0A8H7LCZ5_9AGAM|nr:hypothetical protein RHS04_09705 [Rhizoctonia solani]
MGNHEKGKKGKEKEKGNGKGKGKDKDKKNGKAKSLATQNSDSVALATERALSAKHANQRRLAAANRQRLEAPLTNLETIKQSPDPYWDDEGSSSDSTSNNDSSDDDSSDDDDDDDDNSSDEDAVPNTTSNPVGSSSKKVAKLRRKREKLDAKIAYYHANTDRNVPLDATPGASGSGSHNLVSHLVDTPVAPVTCGEPALDPQPIHRPPLVPQPSNAGFRRLIPIPEKKTGYKLGKIQRKAGLKGNGPRWKEINDIIRDLSARVGLDFTNTWGNQDKALLGHLYNMILEKVPEFARFENGWAPEIIVHRKFDNRIYHMRKRTKNPTAPVNCPLRKPRQPPQPAPNPPSEPASQVPTNQVSPPLNPCPGPSCLPTRIENNPCPPPLYSSPCSLANTHQDPVPIPDPGPPRPLSSDVNPVQRPRTLHAYFGASIRQAPQGIHPCPQTPVRTLDAGGDTGTQSIPRESSHELAVRANPISPHQSRVVPLEPLLPICPSMVGPSSISGPVGSPAFREQPRSPCSPTDSPLPTPAPPPCCRLRKNWNKWAKENNVDNGTSHYALRSRGTDVANAGAQTAAAVEGTTNSQGDKKRKANQPPPNGTDSTKKRRCKDKKLANSSQLDDTDSGGRATTEEDA